MQVEAEQENASDVDDIARIINKYKERITNPISAIRSHCVECMGAAVREVAACTDTDCSLFAFRMGTNVMDARSIKARESE